MGKMIRLLNASFNYSSKTYRITYFNNFNKIKTMFASKRVRRVMSSVSYALGFGLILYLETKMLLDFHIVHCILS